MPRSLGAVPVQIGYGLANDAHKNLVQEIWRQNTDRSRAPPTQRSRRGIGTEAHTQSFCADALPRHFCNKMRLDPRSEPARLSRDQLLAADQAPTCSTVS